VALWELPGRRGGDGEIRVTDNGRTVAKIVPEAERPEVPYFARRKLTAAFKKLEP
jgi:antitoxin (DNA-binding transcriptional repressor) of toxin-antitoxin stability system